MARSVKWTETVGGVPTDHQIDAEDADFAALQSFIATAPAPARYLSFGEAAVLPNGTVLSLGMGGEVYLDGKRLPGVAAGRLAQVGLSICARGLLDPRWWRWNAPSWALIADFDPNLLK